MATYYVNHATGSNGNDGLSSANAWADLLEAVANTSNGDIVVVEDDGSYSSAINFSSVVTLDCFAGVTLTLTAGIGSSTFLNVRSVVGQLTLDLQSFSTGDYWSGATAHWLKVVDGNCSGSGISGGDIGFLWSENCTASQVVSSTGLGSFLITNCSGTGISSTDGRPVQNGIIYNPGQRGVDVRQTLVRNVHVIGAGQYGFRYFSNSLRGQAIFIDCVAWDSAEYGFSGSGSSLGTLVNCFGGNNASGNVNQTFLGDAVTNLTADPYVDSANGDFNINDAAGGGEVLRAANEAFNASTDFYPFRNFVSDSFGGGGGGGGGGSPSGIFINDGRIGV